MTDWTSPYRRSSDSLPGHPFRDEQPGGADHVPVDLGDEWQVCVGMGSYPVGVGRELVRADAAQLRERRHVRRAGLPHDHLAQSKRASHLFSG
jgi:hypothetical protein